MKGGIAVLSHATALEFHRAGHEVLVVASATNAADARDYDRQQPFKTVRFPGTLPWRELLILPVVWAQLRRFAPDVVWSALWYPAGVAVSYAAQPGTLQSVSTYGSEVFVSTADWKLKLKAAMGPWRRRVFQRCRQIFALSRYTREKIVELGAPPDKIEIVPGGVNEKWFQLPRLPQNPGTPVLLTVARLDEHKGHDKVIQALPRILQHSPELRYVLVGPGAENWPRLRRMAVSLGVERNVEYLGPVSLEELHRAYQEATVFVMASREVPNRLDLVEGFGLTFVEAGAVGVPCVAGNSGGVPDAVQHEVTGLLVTPESPEEIAAAIIRLLRDPELASRLGEQARERAKQQLQWKQLAGQMLAAYERLRDRRTGKGLLEK
jgi:phosphatidyl-myo-inositol dimannoside synthase